MSYKNQISREDPQVLEKLQTEMREDIFMRVENFKDRSWYDNIALFTRIGVCKVKEEHSSEVCKVLEQLGYSVRLKTRNGELYVLPTKDKKPKETEAR